MLNNRTQFKEYCLRALGEPLIQINMSPEQVDDRIDDALSKFWEFHEDGSVKDFYKHIITVEDKNNKYINLDDKGIISVLKLLTPGNNFNQVNLEAVAFLQQLHSIPLGSLSTYTVTGSFYSMLNDFIVQARQLRYNEHDGKMFIDTDWDLIEVGELVIIECYKATNELNYPKIFNDTWLKQYATALIKKNWGQNMLKYNGFQLPSGISLDGRAIFQDALMEIQDLEKQLFDTYSLPPDFFMA